MPTKQIGDLELEAVKSAFLHLDPDGTRTAQVLRDTFDQLYDGQRTGRYRWDQLYKTEKTHCGTLVEINLHREFGFGDGTKMDYTIAGIEVDCKYSQELHAWMIPPEAQNHVCLVLTAEDSSEPKWSMGLVRVKPEYLHSGANRDAKSKLNEAGRDAIVWLFRDADLPPNVLLQLDRVSVDNILKQKSGQKKVNDLFRLALKMRVGRAAIATAGQQLDPMKRIRGNGGARSALLSDGIIILGQYQDHCDMAKSLGVPIPAKGESVAVKIAPASSTEKDVVKIQGSFWRVFKPGDKVVKAPILPKVKNKRK